MTNFNCDRDCDHLSPEGKCMFGYCDELSQAVRDGRPMCERLRKEVIEHERRTEKDECISRRAAIDIVREECRKYTTMCIMTMNRLEKLPSIHSKPLVGKWLDLRDGTATCSVCGRRTGHYDDDNADRYCSYCGAKMEG